MGYLEDKISNSLVEKPLVWWRYIDNIFMIWQHGEGTLQEIFKNLIVVIQKRNFPRKTL